MTIASQYLSDSIDALEGLAKQVVREKYPYAVRVKLHLEPVSDMVQLVVDMQNGSSYVHPRFATRQDVLNRRIDHFQEKIDSMMYGIPRTKFPSITSVEFSLGELEEAEKMVNECQSR